MCCHTTIIRTQLSFLKIGDFFVLPTFVLVHVRITFSLYNITYTQIAEVKETRHLYIKIAKKYRNIA